MHNRTKGVAAAGMVVSMAALLAGCGSSTPAATAPPKAQSVLTVATIGDPPSLDPQATTANITADDMQGVFQYLFTFAQGYKIVPMLASSYTVTDGGKLYTIQLRHPVLFQNMHHMTSADVVASLNRWMQVSPIGQNDAKAYGMTASADGKYAIKIQLSQPYAQLLGDLAMWYGGPAIYPASVVKATGTGPLKTYIGTGPYKFVKWIPGRYLEVKKFPQYSQSNLPASWYGGKVTGTVDEIKYIPVPSEPTRLAGLISGQYDVAESLDPSAYQQVASNSALKPEVVKPFAYPMIVFNKKQGLMTNVKIRQAFLAALNMKDLLLAGFGNPKFFDVTGSLYPKQQPEWYSTVGTSAYNQANPTLAKKLLAEAGYHGQPVRWLVSQQYLFLYKMAEAAVPMLQKAGFNVKLDVVDWATLVQERNNPALYDAFFTYNAFSPEPPVSAAWTDPAWPGWWTNAQAQQLLKQLAATTSLSKRQAIWAQYQKLFYQRVPLVDPGQFYNFEAISTKVHGFVPTYSPFFYDVSVK